MPTFRGFWLKHSYNFYRSECVIISYDILIIIQIYIFCNPFYKTLHIFSQKCKPIIFSITKTPIKTTIFRAFSPIFVIYYPQFSLHSFTPQLFYPLSTFSDQVLLSRNNSKYLSTSSLTLPIILKSFLTLQINIPPAPRLSQSNSSFPLYIKS